MARRPTCKPYHVTDNARRVCKSKRVYKTRAEADLAIKTVWIELGRDLGKYTCNVCREYHLTSYQKTFTLRSPRSFLGD